MLAVKDAGKIKAGMVLATWDPHTSRIITEYAGEVRFENVEEGVTVAKQIDETTGLSSLVVIDPKRRGSAASKGLRPAVKLINEKGKEIKQTNSDAPVNYTFQIGAIITVKNGQQVGVGEVMARIPQESSKTRDITGGLPRVAELFEARSPKDAGLLAEVTGTVSFGKDTKGKQRLVITDFDGIAHEYLIPKDKHVTAHDGQVVNKGESIVDGPADPHDILKLQGMEALARYITDEVQDVYRLQGVKINDKHIEVIVRQMLRRIEVEEPGDTPFIVGEQVERAELLEENEKAVKAGKKPGTFRNILLGITKASLSPDSLVGIQRQQTNPGRWAGEGWTTFRDAVRAVGIELLEEPSTRGIFATDAGGTAYGMPHGVVIARSATQISALLKAAQAHRVPVTVRGGGLTTEGESIAYGGVLLDMTGMSQVVEVDERSLTVRTQAGIFWAALAERLRRHGLDYLSAPLNLTSSVGGTLGVGGI